MSCLFLELFKDIVVPSKPAFLSWVDMKLEMLGWGCAQVGTAELVIPSCLNILWNKAITFG